MQFAWGEILWDVVQIYNGMILLWCLISWFPNIRRSDQPWKTLDMCVEPIIAPFRKFIPPINGIDLSPMIATAVLYFVASQLRAML